MFRLSGQSDLVIGIPIAGQSELENGHLVAHCVATLPLRCRINPDATFSQFLKDLRSTFLDGSSASNVTFGSLISKLTDRARPEPASADLRRVQHRQDRRRLSTSAIFPSKRVETPKRFVTFDLNVNVVDSGPSCSSNATITAISWSPTRSDAGWGICRRCSTRSCAIQSRRLAASIS